MKTTKSSFEKKSSRYTLALTLDILARFVLFLCWYNVRQFICFLFLCTFLNVKTFKGKSQRPETEPPLFNHTDWYPLFLTRDVWMLNISYRHDLRPIIVTKMVADYTTGTISGVTVLLSLTVFNIMVIEMLPRVSDALPILGRWPMTRRWPLWPWWPFAPGSCWPAWTLCVFVNDPCRPQLIFAGVSCTAKYCTAAM